jgi:hypothetical protein
MYWRMQVLLLWGGNQKVVDVVGGWYGASNEQHALGACVEPFQGHVIKPSLHGWHLSSNLHTFLARLIVPFGSSELDVRATAHIQRCDQTPRRYGVYSRCCSLPTMDRPLPLVPGVVTMPCWASKVSGEMISSYRKPQRRSSLTKCDAKRFFLASSGSSYTQLGSCHGPAGGAPAAGPAEGCRPSASRGLRPPTWRGAARNEERPVRGTRARI